VRIKNEKDEILDIDMLAGSSCKGWQLMNGLLCLSTD